MGILDSIYSATYSAYSATEKAKQIAPDLTPVMAACRSSCNYSWTAVTKVNSVVMENVVPTLNYFVYDEQGREKTGRVAVSFAKHAAFEGLKWVPGGVPMWNIVSRSLRDAKTEDYNKELVKKLQDLEDRIDGLERESSGSKNIPDDVKLEREASVFKMNQADVKFETQVVPCSNSNTNLKPDDVITVFMMKEVYGRNMFDDLVAPGVRHGKISRKEP